MEMTQKDVYELGKVMEEVDGICKRTAEFTELVMRHGLGLEVARVFLEETSSHLSLLSDIVENEDTKARISLAIAEVNVNTKAILEKFSSMAM